MAESSGKFGRVVLGEDLQPKKPAGELLRADLRSLPADLLTKDEDDAERVHESDPEHIIEALVDEYKDRHSEQPENGEPPLVASREMTRSNPQLAVDLVRLRVLFCVAHQNMEWHEEGVPMQTEPFWLHFNDKTDFNDNYEARPMPLPRQNDLPKYLRGLDLVVDVMAPALLAKISENLKRHLVVPGSIILAKTNLILPNNQLVRSVLDGSH